MLNIVAYVVGKAAKVTPPAVINHTSFPSQNGPMALYTVLISLSDLATNGKAVPRPKSESVKHEINSPE